MMVMVSTSYICRQRRRSHSLRSQQFSILCGTIVSRTTFRCRNLLFFFASSLCCAQVYSRIQFQCAVHLRCQSPLVQRIKANETFYIYEFYIYHIQIFIIWIVAIHVWFFASFYASILRAHTHTAIVGIVSFVMQSNTKLHFVVNGKQANRPFGYTNLWFSLVFSAVLVPFTVPSEAFVYICIVHTPFLVARLKFIFWYFSLIGDYATEHSTYACYFRHAHKLWQNPETDATL